MPIVDSEELLQDLKDSESEDLTPLVDFITEGNPFGADELVPEPFLWADDYKCIPVRYSRSTAFASIFVHFSYLNVTAMF